MKLKSSKWLKAQLRGRYLLMRLPEDQKKNSSKREKFLDENTVAVTKPYGSITHVDTTVEQGEGGSPNIDIKERYTISRIKQKEKLNQSMQLTKDIKKNSVIDIGNLITRKRKKAKRKNKKRKPRKLQDKVNLANRYRSDKY